MAPKSYCHVLCSVVRTNYTIRKNYSFTPSIDSILNEENFRDHNLNFEGLPFLLAVLLYFACFLLVSVLGDLRNKFQSIRSTRSHSIYQSTTEPLHPFLL